MRIKRLTLLTAAAALLAACGAPAAAPEPGPAANPGAAAARAATIAAIPAEIELVGQPYSVFLARDPFRPVRPDILLDDAPGQPEPDLGIGVELVDVFTGEDGLPRGVFRQAGVLYTVQSQRENTPDSGVFGDSAQFTVVAIDSGCAQVETAGGFFIICEGQGPLAAPVSLNGPDGPTTQDGCASVGGSTSCDGLLVELVDVGTVDGQEVATVSIAGAVYEVTEGQQFASNFQVLAIDAPCATLLYGDDAVTLCEGDRILK